MSTQRKRWAKRGFTLVELIVAIMILSVGILGLAGTAVMVTRLTGDGSKQTQAANIAAMRFERLRGGSCTITPWPTGGQTTAGFQERGRATDAAVNGFVPVIDSVRFVRGEGRFSAWFVFQTRIPCT
jgi:prepilin-type N-terminal cleavage/methylation domain-containing protein